MGRAKAVTLYDVATAAGVSPKTVSRVVNHDSRVLPTTRERVQAVIQALNYAPDPLARSLRTGSDRTIGLVVESVDDPFFAAITATVKRRMAQAGYTVYVVSTYRDAGRLRTTLEGLLQRRVAGLIVAPSMTEPHWYSTCRVPLVFIDRPAPGVNADVVRVDDEAGARLATEHLLAHGHHRIGYIGGPNFVLTARDRRQGYRQALLAAGVGADERHEVDDVVDATDGAEAVQHLLSGDDAVTAIFVAAARCLEGS